MENTNSSPEVSTQVVEPIAPVLPVIPPKKWVSELAQKWNSETYSLFILHGNIFDIFPMKTTKDGKDTIRYISLKRYLAEGLFKNRACMLYYDIGDGLSFGSKEMQGDFYKWLEIYDKTEHTNYTVSGLPKDFIRLTPILKRYINRVTSDKDKKGVSLIIDFAEKIVPSNDGTNMSNEERMSVVSILKWGISPEMRCSDVGIFLITEVITELQSDLVRNPHFAQINIELPDKNDRLFYLQNGFADTEVSKYSDLTMDDLADRTSGLNLVRIQHIIGEVVHNEKRITSMYISDSKKRLIEEFCQGLVKFVEPKVGVTLDNVATHFAAKQKFRELAWLIKNNKKSVLERGVLLPGRIGVGKSFIVYCFASECGLPVLEIGDFRSKWVGDTEKQQSRILMIIKALGPVIIVVDEADAVFGNRSSSGDSGVSTRVFAAFAAHIGDSSLRGREIWIAMTSRPDLMAIDMKRQGRFGLCMPLFPAKDDTELKEMFTVVSKVNKVTITDEIMNTVIKTLSGQRLTGSEVESIVLRAKERAVLAQRDENVMTEDYIGAIESFIDPLDPQLLRMQELAAVLACSDKRYLPELYLNAKREELYTEFLYLKSQLE